MSELSPPLVLSPFVDRRSGLVGFGILAIILGSICALISPLLGFSQIAIGGVLAVCVTGWIAANLQPPQTDRGGAAINDAAMTMVKVSMMGTITVIFALLPAFFVWVYSRAGVKSTCEVRNPESSWTDQCPLPVLAACLFFGVGAFPIGTLVLRGLPARTWSFGATFRRGHVPAPGPSTL